MIPPEPGPDPPGPDPPTPTPTYNDWAYDSMSKLDGIYDVYVGVDSASSSFVGVVCVGLNTSPSWYSDGSLLKIGDKLYPFDATNDWYYNYDDHNLYRYNYNDGDFRVVSYNPTVFDQVPADFLSYLSTGNYTLTQAP